MALVGRWSSQLASAALTLSDSAEIGLRLLMHLTEEPNGSTMLIVTLDYPQPSYNYPCLVHQRLWWVS